jgi:hypothetical protein
MKTMHEQTRTKETDAREIGKETIVMNTTQQPVSEKPTLREILGPTWQIVFRKEKEIKQILKSAGVKDQNFQNIHRTCSIDDNRLTLIVNTIRKDTLYANRVVIDVIMGEPTWDQMMDVTFGGGYGCSPRIIVCDSRKEDAFFLDGMVYGFVEISNDCGLTTCVLGARAKLEGIEYRAFEGGKNGPLMLDKFPSREGFEQTELMVYYSLANEGEPPIYGEMCPWPCYSWVVDVENSDLEASYPVWRQSGLFMLFTTKSEKGMKQLKWLLEEKGDFLREKFEQFRVEYDSESGLPMELVARVWDRPFSEFVYADERRKHVLAKKVADLNTGQDWDITELMNECTIV